jgi:hypothetical protein
VSILQCSSNLLLVVYMQRVLTSRRWWVSCCQVVDARRNNNDSRWVAKQGGEEQVWNEVADALTTRGWWGRTASAVINIYHKQNRGGRCPT